MSAIIRRCSTLFFFPILPLAFSPGVVLDGMKEGVCTLSGPPCAPGVPSHGHRFDVPNHIVQVGDGALQLPAVDGLSGLARVFEGDTEVGAAGAGGFCGFDRGGCVADLLRGKRRWLAFCDGGGGRTGKWRMGLEAVKVVEGNDK